MIKNRLFTFLVMFTSILFLLNAHNAIAVTANPNPVRFVQPNGSVITIILKGDEFIHWAATTDGYTLLSNKSGAYEYAVLLADGKMGFSGMQANDPDKRGMTERNFLAGISKGIFFSTAQITDMKESLKNEHAPNAPLDGVFPTTGTRKLLVILANFSNTTITYPQANFNNYMNQVNYNGTGSFKDYYLEVSYGQLIVNSTVTIWVTLPNTHDYYGPETMWGQFAFDAVTAANNQASVNFAEFDNNLDGIVDGVAIFHQGQGQEETGSTLDIWSHSWDLSSAGFTAAQRTFDGVLVDAYTTMPERNSTGMGTIGVMCHEFGHNLGSPDFYDTDYSTGGQYDGTGDWDLMASGSWNGTSGDKPAHHNAYTKAYVYGWTTPAVMTTNISRTLRNAEIYTDVVRYNTSTPNEYFLCENRQQVGFDIGIPGHGLIIFHVDGSYIALHSGANNINAGSHQGMYPVCANSTGNPPASYGTINGGGCPFPGTGNKTSFTDATTPNSHSWAGASTNYPLTTITENTSSKEISFCFISCTTPDDPSAFTATPFSSSQINLTWIRNAGNSNVLVAYNSTNVFGTPVAGTSYAAGNSISGGGSVLYNGANLSFSHSGLSPNTTCYYKAWSVLTGVTYSTGVIASASTPCAAVSVLPFTESFTNTTVPNCWTQVDNQGNGQIWLFGTITGQSPNPALTGNYAYLNSDAYGSSTSQNADLVTPTLNLSAYSTVTLAFNHYFKSYTGSSGTLSYSINNGTSWTTIASFTTTSASNPAAFSQAIAAVAGQAQVKFKWNYTGTYGYYWGIDDISITGTAVGPAVVTTTAASSIYPTTATSGGNVTSIGTSAVTARGVCWSTTVNPVIAGNHTTDGAGIGTFTSSITGLSANTTYHIRAYATNTSGTSYGADLTFLTLGAATVTTTVATSVTMSTAISGGNVTSDGGVAVTARGVCWATTLNPVATDSHTTDGSGTGTFTSSISGLSPSTTYHYRAYATNATGTFYGSDLTFPTSCSSVTAFPWSEGFENAGSIPICWTQEMVSSSGIYYTFITGNGGSNPAAAHAGTYNACLKDASIADNKTKLISPSINLTGVTSPTLTFWHTQAFWSPDQDQLTVFYRTSAGGTWTSLVSYTTSVTAWTQRTISLPNGSGDYYIAFEGNAKYGYGVCIDDVQITCTALPVSVSVVPSANPVCAGTSVTYTATPANGGNSPAYQWKVNGTSVTGATNTTYSFIPNTGNTVACILTSSAACITGSPATSNTITMTVNPSLPVSISITPSANPVVSGSSVVFTATPVNGGATPGYQWKVNAASVTGATNTTYTCFPANNDAVTCVLTSNATCAAGSPATSAAVTMTVYPLTLGVTPSNQNVSDASGSTLFTVTSNTSWTVVSNQVWCTVNPSGTGNGSIAASYSQNLLVTPRIASVTTTATGLTPVTVTVTQSGISEKVLNLTLFLEGLFNGTTMNKAKNASGDQFSGTVADQITLELHQSTSPYALAGGPYTVNVNTDGTAMVTVPASLGSSYFIVVKHRNSIETWNASPLSFSGATMSYNFSSSAAQALGNNLKLVAGKYLIFAGDVNQDGLVDAADLVSADNDAANFLTGYLTNDVNGDGIVNLADLFVISTNASAFIAKIVP